MFLILPTTSRHQRVIWRTSRTTRCTASWLSVLSLVTSTDQTLPWNYIARLCLIPLVFPPLPPFRRINAPNTYRVNVPRSTTTHTQLLTLPYRQGKSGGCVVALLKMVLLSHCQHPCRCATLKSFNWQLLHWHVTVLPNFTELQVTLMVVKNVFKKIK